MDRSCIDTIVNKSKQMQKDGTGHKKAEIIVWYQDHEYGMLPSEYHEYKICSLPGAAWRKMIRTDIKFLAITIQFFVNIALIFIDGVSWSVNLVTCLCLIRWKKTQTKQIKFL